MNRAFLTLIAVSIAAMSLAVLAQESMTHDDMKHDEMKHDNMQSDEMKPTDMADHKPAHSSRSFRLPSSAQLDGKQLAPGQYRIRWEGTGPDVQVSFTQGKKVLATVPAKIVELSETTANDAAVVQRDGTDALKEIRFAGKKYALMFGSDSAEADHHMKAGGEETTSSNQ